MDAREYLARKGLDGSRDEERPNTLEEKAWERARQAGGHQPRAGTPHDWEDWERYHEELAEGAETIDLKIDHEAHRQASRFAQAEHEADPAVQEFVPPAEACPALSDMEEPTATPPAWQESAVLRFSYKALAVLLPPLAVGLAQGGGRRVAISLALTLLGWVPGCLYAWSWLRRRLG
ncbi:YqaE/Pmp3 family membrane protein [Halomonas sp. A29]|uniref:YqaE/Pmp3 family membrane protein n=1 Tax=Halomonas sp. A29 TaxID=3102786 RepID=UPI00398B6F74